MPAACIIGFHENTEDSAIAVCAFFFSRYGGIGQDSSSFQLLYHLSYIRHLLLSRDRADDGIRTHDKLIKL